MDRSAKNPSDPLKDIDLRLPLGASSEQPRHRARIIAHHLVITGYGHWLPNDIRGSGSVEVKQEQLRDIGPIHYGRKRKQPDRNEIGAFFRKAEPLLQFERIWFDHAKRQAVADAFSKIIERRYTVWACAICKNHAHLCIRAHRDTADMMWTLLTDAGRKAIRTFSDVPPDHEVWTRAPYTVFLSTPDEIWQRVDYINRNPIKEGLAPQNWPFVQPYDNWPLHRRCNET
jgi:REP element-mobilizing transposase RayT